MIDIAIVGVYLAGTLFLGLWAGRHIKTLNEYSVAGRSYTTWTVFATLSASFIGGGFTMGNAEKVFLLGIVNIFALWGFSLKELLVASVIAPRTTHFPEFVSVGDIMVGDYGKIGKVVTGVCSVLLCAGIVGAQVGAMGYIFDVFLGITPLVGIIVGCGIVITYSTVGGMKAIVWTDVLQFCVLVIGIPLALVVGVIHVGGWSAIKAAAPASHFTILGGKPVFWFVSLFLTFLLGETLVPPYVQRLFIAKDAGHTVRGTFLSGLASIPFFAITGGIGLVALTMNPGLNPNQALPFVIKTVLPIGLAGLVTAGVCAIVMSSADSFLNAAAIGFVNDIVNPLRKEPLEERRALITAKLTTLFVGLGAVVFAIKIKSILDILIYSYNFWSPIILVPLVAAILRVNAGRAAFIAGAVAGAAGVIAWNHLLGNPASIDGLIIGVICNLIVFSAVHYARKQG